MSRPISRKTSTILATAAAIHCLPAVAGIPILTRRLPSGGPDARGRSHITLTFDDGPHPDGTPAILDVLGQSDASATFFVIGEQLERHPDLGRRIIQEGHEIAVHGWDHRCLLTVGPSATITGLRRTVDLITETAGRPPRRFRPPYGVPSAAVLLACRRLGLSPTWWTAWGRDWASGATCESICREVEHGLQRRRCGATVLLHDSDRYGTAGSWRATAAATGRMLREWAAMGWTAGSAAGTGRPSPVGRTISGSTRPGEPQVHR